MSRLVLMSKSTTVKLVALKDGVSAVLGREDHCDVVISSAHASRKHAELLPDGDVAVLTDLGSSNGTFVNGRRIQQHVLRHGDVLTIGGWEMRFLASEVATPSATLALIDA